MVIIALYDDMKLGYLGTHIPDLGIQSLNVISAAILRLLALMYKH